MELIDKEGWDETLRNDPGSYWKAVVDYCERWADLMDERLSEGRKLAEIAGDTSQAADTEGITGFMYGCAVSILSQVWAHGEALRCWHNLEMQIGTEGEQANESGGVLNPACLSIQAKDS